VHEARGVTRNFRLVGSSTHTAASRRLALSSGEDSGMFLAKDLCDKKGHARDIFFSLCRRIIFGASQSAPSLFSHNALLFCYLLARQLASASFHPLYWLSHNNIRSGHLFS
jgi:hypothetical protein